MEGMANTEVLRGFARTLRDVAQRCELVASLSVVLEGDAPKDEFARIIAHLVQDGKVTDVRSWLKDVERRSVAELVRRGANTPELGRALGCSTEAAQQYLYRQGWTINGLREGDES
jgi:hypothetical protein